MNQTDPSATPLKTTNRLHRFSERAEDYAKYRPNYPAAAVDTILEGVYGSPSPLLAADIGAGTGISSHQLAERGVHVLAIEPDPAMRQAAVVHPLIEFCEGTAEATNLPDASVDLVTCFQSFHWFEPRRSLQEFRRILRRSGRLALVWSFWDKSDKFTADYMRLISQLSFSNRLQSLVYYSRSSGTESLISSFVKRWSVWLSLYLFLRLPYFVDVHRHSFSFNQKLDLSGLIGLAMSQSTIPLSGSGQNQLVSKVQELYERSCTSDGFVDLAYRTTVYLAEPLRNE